MVRSRASTPGLSYASGASSAFSELKNDSQDVESVTDNRSDDGNRQNNRSPRPSVLLPTKGKISDWIILIIIDFNIIFENLSK